MNLLLIDPSPEEIIAQQTPILLSCIVIGWISFILTQVITISQLVAVYKTRNTSSISIWTYIILIFGSLLSISWAFCYYIKSVYGQGGGSWSIFDPTTGRAIGWDNDIRQALLPLVQWGIIPLISYNLADIGLGILLVIIKFRHAVISRKTHVSEFELAKVMLDKQRKEFIASGKKLSKRKYFDLAIQIPIVYIVVGVATYLIFKFMVPESFDKGIDDSIFFWQDGLMIISVISAFGWEAVSWPTFINTLKKRDTAGISMNWAIFLPVSMTIQFFYALILAIAELSAAGGITEFPPDTIGTLVFNGLIVNYGVLVLKVKNKKTAKKLHMTELQYTERILIPEYERKIAARKEVQRQIEIQQAKVIAERERLSKMKTDSKKTEKKIYKEATKEYKKRLARNKKRRQRYAKKK